ncbi:hypothetical protein D3C77_508130 [compost metagenome]
MGGAVFSLRVNPKSGDAFRGAGRAKPHLRPDDGPACAFDRFISRFPSTLEFLPGIWRQYHRLKQRCPCLRVLQHAEQVHDVTVQVVVNLGVGTGLLHQNTGGTAEGLDIAGVPWEILGDPRRQPELGAVVPDYRR